MRVGNEPQLSRSHVVWGSHRLSWLSVMVGDSSSVENARSTNLLELSMQAQHSNASDCEQIELDLNRSASPTSACYKHARDLTNILQSWVALNKGIGYSQGMDMMCIMLHSHFIEADSPKPLHDTLAALGFVCRVNAAFIPLHPHDKTPMNSAALFATEVWLEISSANPSLGALLLPCLGYVEIFAIKYLAVCFANLFSSSTLRVVWNYLFDSTGLPRSAALSLAARRCRHYTSASFILYKKLFQHGKDTTQNFSIFENLLAQLTDNQAAQRTIEIARHLERVETLGGSAK